jgi:hypothetical protein
MTWRAESALRQACGVAAVLGLITHSAWAAQPHPQDFNSFLVEGYGQMANAGRSAHDPRQPYFRERAALAARDEGILPVDPDKRYLDSWSLREADFARRQLVLRLDAGARQKQALLAAIAQVNFDCWAAPLPRQFSAPDRDECRRRFYFAFAGLVPGGSDLSPEDSPDGAAGATVAASARQTGARPLIATPAATASASASSTGTGRPNWARPSLASIVLGGSQQIECDRNGQNCVPLAFTGPSADVLIHDLRGVGADNDGAGGQSSAANVGGRQVGAGNSISGSDSSSNSNSGNNTSSSNSSNNTSNSNSGNNTSSSNSGNNTSSSNSSNNTSSNSTGTASGSTSPGNGKGKGKGHGNGHGKGPG